MLQVIKLHKTATVPERKTDGAAGYDLSLCTSMMDDASVLSGYDVSLHTAVTDTGTVSTSMSTSVVPARICLYPRDRKLLSTGVVLIIPKGHFGMIASRSGMAFNRGLDVRAGIIDSDYRGEIKVLLENMSSQRQEILDGERIAQLLVLPYAALPVQTITDRSATEVAQETKRGDGGFGSTGRS